MISKGNGLVSVKLALMLAAYNASLSSFLAPQADAFLLFDTLDCLRTTPDLVGPEGPACSNSTLTFHEVSSHAIDPMMRRLMVESRLMAQDDPVAVKPESSRWKYVWEVARVDLSDGLADLAALYRSDALKVLVNLDALFIVVLVLVLLTALYFIFFLFRPFVKASYIGG